MNKNDYKKKMFNELEAKGQKMLERKAALLEETNEIERQYSLLQQEKLKLFEKMMND